MCLNVTWLSLNQKGTPPAKPGVSRGSGNPAATEKFNCGCFLSAALGSFPGQPVFFLNAPVSFQKTLISFQMALKNFHLQPWFLSDVDNSRFCPAHGTFSVDNYVDKLWIAKMPGQQSALEGSPDSPPSICLHACSLQK